MRKKQITIGWYGIPGDYECKSTLTHATLSNKYKPLCGTKLNKRMEFQLCNTLPSMYPASSHPECKTCNKIFNKIIRENK